MSHAKKENSQGHLFQALLILKILDLHRLFHRDRSLIKRMKSARQDLISLTATVVAGPGLAVFIEHAFEFGLLWFSGLRDSSVFVGVDVIN